MGRERTVAAAAAWAAVRLAPDAAVAGWTLAAAALVLVVPLAVLAAGLVVYEAALLLEAISPGAAGRAASAYVALVDAAFDPGGLPTWLPRLALLIWSCRARGAIACGRAQPARAAGQTAAAGRVLVGGAGGADGRRRGRRVLPRGALGAHARRRRGSASRTTTDLARRYAELLADNLGQPGFRELLIVVHDLDARRDLVFALLGPEERRPFFLRKTAHGAERRSAEAFDLAGVARDQSLHALAGALAVPGLTEPPLVVFPAESYWRGEAHRLCDRPGALGPRARGGGGRGRAAGDRRHGRRPSRAARTRSATRRAAPRARVGDYLAAAQAAGVRDALPGRATLVRRRCS